MEVEGGRERQEDRVYQVVDPLTGQELSKLAVYTHPGPVPDTHTCSKETLLAKSFIRSLALTMMYGSKVFLVVHTVMLPSIKSSVALTCYKEEERIVFRSFIVPHPPTYQSAFELTNSQLPLMKTLGS